MEDLAPCPTTFHNLWKFSGIFGTLQKLSLSLQHMHILTFGKFDRFNLDLMILYKTLRLCNFWEPAVESILAFLFNKLWRKIACVASVCVRLRRKERGTRDKDREKSGASKRAGRGWGRKEGNACRQTPGF